MPVIERFATAEATRSRLNEIRRLVDVAFAGDFSERDWDHSLGGLHVVALDDRAVIAHAAVVLRFIDVADRRLATGYVEAVATDPARRREGVGSAVMDEVGILIHEGFEMGALSTGLHAFYRARGWDRWRGPSFVRQGAELLRTEEEDDGLMVLRFGVSHDVDLTATISCEARAGDDW